jgi:peptidoglycan hydrolase CwlO-like protein
MRAILAALVMLAALGGGLFGVSTEDSTRASQLSHQITQLRSQLSSDQAEMSSLSHQVGTLTVPSDPLSAYNTVCNQDMTNSNNDLTEVYYFPCTNSAQTIPQPGS